jgi:hypothetical protein
MGSCTLHPIRIDDLRMDTAYTDDASDNAAGDD